MYVYEGEVEMFGNVLTLFFAVGSLKSVSCWIWMVKYTDSVKLYLKSLSVFFFTYFQSKCKTFRWSFKLLCKHVVCHRNVNLIAIVVF